MILFIVMASIVIIFCFGYAQIVRHLMMKQYDENKEKRLMMEQKYLRDVMEIAKSVQPNLEGKTIVNGQYVKSIKVGIQVTTYYSYLIILDEQRHGVQVVSYHADTKESKDCGFFTKERVVPINLYEGAQTNYKFLDENLKETFVVQTVGVPSRGDYNSEYELQYSQLNSYSKLRSFFDLSTDLKLIQTGERS